MSNVEPCSYHGASFRERHIRRHERTLEVVRLCLVDVLSALSVIGSVVVRVFEVAVVLSIF